MSTHTTSMVGGPVKKIPIMEIFGPTIQGEGRVIGQKTMFVRTGGCDYSCSWCDSKFTWDGSEKASMMTPAEVFGRLLVLSGGEPLNFNHATITGGNPALIGEAMAEFIRLCHIAKVHVSLETQGSRWQDWFPQIDELCISPKPPSSGMVTDWEKLDYIVNRLSRLHGSDPFSHFLKVVVFNDADFEFAKKVHKRYPDVQMFVSVGNTDTETMEVESHNMRLLDKLGWLFDKILGDPEMNAVRPLPQLHTLVWGNRRKV